jgi:enoyl-CoA hydratase
VPEFDYLTYERLDGGSIIRILLNRPKYRNAQNRGLLVELDDALVTAEADDQVRVIILGGLGPMFSAGHDLGSPDRVREETPGPDQHRSYRTNGGQRPAPERRMLQEWHYFFNNTRRWRNLRKITIAQVHGNVFSAGLMLIWCCDLIVASDRAVFADVVGSRLGMCGVEYFAHPWEFGPRKTKELMLTGDSITALEAYELGMVSKLFPDAELSAETLRFARRISERPTMTALLVKESVNQSVDNMGFQNALSAFFTLHQLNHSHWAELSDGETIVGMPKYGVPSWRDAPPIRQSVRDAVEGPTVEV